MIEIKGTSPHADFYPMLSDEAIAELADDIKENGQRDPITVNRNGILLDGRNRLKACQMIGVDPLIEVYEGNDDGAFVRSRNERRHQGTGSRAMSTALSMVEDDLRGDGRWRRGAVDIPTNWNSSRSSGWREALNRAGTVLDYAADLADDVVDGRVTLADAYGKAKAEKERIENAERRKQELIDREREEEEAAKHFFATNNAAGVWVTDRLDQFDSMAVARVAYERVDREARLKREEEERAAEQERQRLKTEDKRVAMRLQSFTEAYSTALEFRTHDRREQVLACLEKPIREEYLTLEKHIKDWSLP